MDCHLQSPRRLVPEQDIARVGVQLGHGLIQDHFQQLTYPHFLAEAFPQQVERAVEISLPSLRPAKATNERGCAVEPQNGHDQVNDKG